MIKRYSLLKLFLLLFVVIAHHTMLFADQKEVKNIIELNNAIEAAKPGDVIIMTDGEWNNVAIDFKSVATQQLPITLKAKNAGKVILTGTSVLQISKPYLIVDGLFFNKGGDIKGNAVILFKSDYGKIINTAIVDYNPELKATDYYWVYFSGNYNELQNCFFKGKNNLQPLIGNDQENSRYNKVSYCHFKDIPFTPDNGREIFRIWGYGRSEETGDDGAFFTVEHNFFERAHGEGSEIVSLKSNRNIVRYNTIFSTRGGITGRSGNFNTIEGNYVLGNNEKGSSGIRLAGQGHQVFNNYISDVTGDGLIIMTGEYIDTALTDKYEPIKRAGTPLGRVPRYGHVKNGLFANNTFVNIGGIGINVGSSYNPNPAADQRMLLPENNKVVNNIVLKTNGGIGISVTQPINNPILNKFKFAPNILEGNITFGSETNSKVSGISVKNPQMSLKNGLYQLEKDSEFLDKGMKTKYKPLTASEVGPNWVIKSRLVNAAQF